MGWNDHYFDRSDIVAERAVCRCGAVYTIREDDGIPGCREIETVDCKYCGQEIARHFGDCSGKLIDSKNVPIELIEARSKYDKQIEEYTKENGYDWSSKKYTKIRKEWRDTIDRYFGISVS